LRARKLASKSPIGSQRWGGEVWRMEHVKIQLAGGS
jgi:hypothetical protein